MEPRHAPRTVATGADIFRIKHRIPEVLSLRCGT